MMQLSTRVFCAVIAGALLVGGGLGAYAAGRLEPRRAAPAAVAQVQAPVLPVQMPLNTGTFAKVADAIKPAVVNINTTGRATGPARTPFEEFFGEEFFRRFFGDAPERIPQRSLGSGVIVDATGIALTNAHVVENAKDIEVVTLDGNKHRAKLVGLDKKTDLAVLKLDDGKGAFSYARLGDSDRMQVGDWVIAVGSPFGLQSTVTAGIISAKARQLGQGPFDDFIQTDAAINPGNSGGPLVNMQGEIIGINTAIVAGGTGIGFAIPSNLARKIYTELNAKGKVTRGWLGVSIQPLTPELAKSFGTQGHEGRPDLRRHRRQPGRQGRPPAGRHPPGVRRQEDGGARRPAARRGLHGARRHRQDEGPAREGRADRRGEDRRGPRRARGGVAARPARPVEPRDGGPAGHPRGRPPAQSADSPTAWSWCASTTRARRPPPACSAAT